MKSKVILKFGHQVRKHRVALGLSQEALAEKAGVHRTYVGMIERGEKNITLANVEKLAQALDVTIDGLMKFD